MTVGGGSLRLRSHSLQPQDFFQELLGSGAPPTRARAHRVPEAPALHFDDRHAAGRSSFALLRTRSYCLSFFSYNPRSIHRYCSPLSSILLIIPQSLLSLGYQAPSPCAESFPCGRSSVIMGRSERQKGKHGSSSYGVNSERRPESTTRVLASRLSYPFLSRSLSLGISERICPAAPFSLSEMDPSGKLPDRVYTKEEILAYVAHGRAKCRRGGCSRRKKVWIREFPFSGAPGPLWPASTVCRGALRFQFA